MEQGTGKQDMLDPTLSGVVAIKRSLHAIPLGAIPLGAIPLGAEGPLLYRQQSTIALCTLLLTLLVFTRRL